MADVTISNLTNRRPNSSAVFPYSEGGSTYNASLNQVIPTGVIVMWSGSIVSIPAGWALCNGSNGTPDLRDRFVVGAGTTYSPNNTGGLSAVQLTTNEIPSHNHRQPFWVSQPDYNNPIAYITDKNGIAASRTAQGVWTNIGGNGNNNAGYQTFDYSTGGGQAHENRPPYYALAYIMKL